MATPGYEEPRIVYHDKQKSKQKSKRPEYRSVVIENIPGELKEMKIWACWKSVSNPDKEKPDKLPISYQINPITSLEEVKPASCNRPNEWMTFEDAVRLKKFNRAVKGFQVALLPITPTDDEDRLIGVDMDKAFNPIGSIKDEYLEWVAKFNTYFELSPGDDINGGVRGFCFGHFPAFGGKHQGNIEIYQNGKWMTITGQKLTNSPATINTSQETIEAFRVQYFKTFNEVDDINLPVSNKIFTDEELIDILKNNTKVWVKEDFNQLFFRGLKTSDHSSDDLSLCNLMRPYTQNIEQIDRIFRQSALMRDKWDEVHFGNGDTYGEGTIKTSLNTRTKVYMDTSTATNEDINDFNVNMYPFVVKNGTEKGIYKEVTLKGTDESILVQVASTPCVIVAIGENIDSGEILYKLKIKDIRGNDKYVWKSTGDLLKRSEVLKLQDEGLHFKESKANDLIDYFDRFITTYSGKLKTDFAASVGGWKKNFTMYVIGNRAITSDGVQEILQLDTQFSPHYGCKGSIEGWVKSASYIANYPAVRFKMYISFVPSLLRLLYLTSHVLDHHVRSGQMKSVSNWLAASMHGNPTAQQAGGDSTTVGIMGLVEYCIDIPTFLDETSQNPEASRKLGYRIGGVGSRLKGSQNGSGDIHSSSITSTVLLATGEHPIIPDNANGGEDVRVQPLTEGVSTRLDEDDVAEMEMLMQENYGHVVVLFMQELFKLKDQLKTIYQGMLAGLPDVGELPEDSRISASRVKKQYAAEATAGFILERVFAKIGLAPMDPLEVCNRYYKMNVMDHGFTPDYIKALEIAYKFYMTNEVYFHEDSEINHTHYGWIREEKTTKHRLICFDEGQLKTHIIKTLGPNRYESAVSVWEQLEILNIRKIPKKDAEGKEIGEVRLIHTMQITVNRQRTTVLQIPLRNFYKYLNITEDPGESHEMTTSPNEDGEENNNGTSDVKASVVPVHPSVTYSINDGIIVPDSNTNLHDLLMESMAGDER